MKTFDKRIQLKTPYITWLYRYFNKILYKSKKYLTTEEIRVIM